MNVFGAEWGMRKENGRGVAIGFVEGMGMQLWLVYWMHRGTCRVYKI